MGKLMVMAACLLAGMAAAQPAFAWGAAGHRIIGRLAIRSLPAGLPAFLHAPDVLWQTGELAREPDRWRGAGPTHDEDLNPGHYINVGDDGKIAGVLPLNALPQSRGDYDTAVRAAVRPNINPVTCPIPSLSASNNCAPISATGGSMSRARNSPGRPRRGPGSPPTANCMS